MLSIRQSAARTSQQHIRRRLLRRKEADPARILFSTNCPFSTQTQNEQEQKAPATPVVEDDIPVAKPPSHTNTATVRVLPSRKLGTTRVPTPPSAPPADTNTLGSLAKASPTSVLRKGANLTFSALKVVLRFLWQTPKTLFYYMMHPSKARQRYEEMKKMVKDEIHHYWVGTKLLWADIQTAQHLLTKTLRGSSLTRRERRQLLRTVTDLFRVVPFSMFIIIPLGEFALPFVLRVFPNMLPSTFQDSLKNEENMKRELQSRIAMAQFFQETLEELAKEQKRKASKRTKEFQEAGVDQCETIGEQEDSAASMLEFLAKARSGQMIPPDVIIRYANYFQDDLTLDNMPRMQLINMCKYMSIPHYGSDTFLRFQLRHRIRVLKEDDQRILWEGIDSLTKMELREACQERGMRSTGLSKDAYKGALQQWLNLSVNNKVPISLLIMSRTFFLKEDMFERKASGVDEAHSSLAGLADAISGLDKEVVNEIILEVATSEEKRANPDVRKIKLEVLSTQNALIREEQEAREAAKKRDKEKSEAQSAAAAAAAAEKKEFETEAATSASVLEKSALPKDAQVKVDDTKEESGVAPVEEEYQLSPHEMDAISQLVSEDPVSKERAELKKIKEAMKLKTEDKAPEAREDAAAVSATAPSSDGESVEVSALSSSMPEAMTSEEAEKMVATTVKEMTQQVESESRASTSISFGTEKGDETSEQVLAAAKKKDEEVLVPEDPVVARLKKKLESMVDKIEVQLSETEIKIGAKLHFLDKDRDGILSKEEMVDALMQVLKRSITMEEALEIANEMDQNHDGVFSVQEMIHWIDEHKLVQFVEEGRDADMDRVLEKHSASAPSSAEPQQAQQHQQQAPPPPSSDTKN